MMYKHDFEIGDVVMCITTPPYKYTIEEISENGDLWGSDLPKPYYSGRRFKNWHNPQPHFTKLVSSKQFKPKKQIPILTLK